VKIYIAATKRIKGSFISSKALESLEGMIGYKTGSIIHHAGPMFHVTAVFDQPNWHDLARLKSAGWDIDHQHHAEIAE
jgi:hypothetical protein